MRKGVLIIEDDSDQFITISRSFKNYDWEVYPEDAEWTQMFEQNSISKMSLIVNEILRQNYNSIDIIVLDIKFDRPYLPEKEGDFGGYEIYKDIREYKFRTPYGEVKFDKIPVIVTSDYFEDLHSDREFGTYAVELPKSTSLNEPEILIYTAHQFLFSEFVLNFKHKKKTEEVEAKEKLREYKDDYLEHYIRNNLKSVFDYIKRGGKGSTFRLFFSQYFKGLNIAKTNSFLDSLCAKFEENRMDLKQALTNEVFCDIVKEILREGSEDCFEEFIKEVASVLECKDEALTIVEKLVKEATLSYALLSSF